MYNDQVQASEIVTYMGAFGAALKKPTRLVGNCRFLRTLVRFPPDAGTERRCEFYTVDPMNRVRGGPALASSAEYPVAFANAVVAGYVRSLPHMQMERPTVIDDDTSSASSIEVDAS